MTARISFTASFRAAEIFSLFPTIVRPALMARSAASLTADMMAWRRRREQIKKMVIDIFRSRETLSTHLKALGVSLTNGPLANRIAQRLLNLIRLLQ
ncbi:hypothetical protein RRG08_020883 [Elysia crispata]|uniref:Uncharacterized protein n=1 Tax=Elysia crispata TaxID=231223 RepID=A0AAE0XUW8_9GAST|nr:hypothetical protein RRG08_020883 [Elysia crispata]